MQLTTLLLTFLALAPPLAVATEPVEAAVKSCWQTFAFRGGRCVPKARGCYACSMDGRYIVRYTLAQSLRGGVADALRSCNVMGRNGSLLLGVEDRLVILR